VNYEFISQKNSRKSREAMKLYIEISGQQDFAKLEGGAAVKLPLLRVNEFSSARIWGGAPFISTVRGAAR
jgi:hypothetical protein